MDVNIKVVIQDARGNPKKKLTLAVQEEITVQELLSGLKDLGYIPDTHYSVYIEPSSKGSIYGNLVGEGSIVIVRPRHSGIQVVDEN